MKPNFLVIGSAKCATTSLCGLLGQHPEICISSPKEPHFFSVDEVYGRGWSWYESLFEGASHAKAIGEGSTSYTRHLQYPNALARIVKDLPDTRLIYIVRNPIKKVESLWMHAKANNIPAAATLSETLQSQSGKFYLDESRYGHQLNLYREHFPDDRILVLFFEDFKTTPTPVIRRCFEFLGVDPTLTIPHAKTPRNISHQDTFVMACLRKIPFFNRAYFALPKRIRYRLNAKLQRPVTTRPQWDEQTKQWFIQQIAQETQAFLESYGKPLDFWPEFQLPNTPATSPAYRACG